RVPGRAGAPGVVTGALAGVGGAARARRRDHVRRGRPRHRARRARPQDREGRARAGCRLPGVAGEDAGRAAAGGGMRLSGKVVLVTGASRGIGRAIALAAAAEGAQVLAAARDEAKLADVVREIEAAGGKASALALDVADRASVDACFERILK